LIKRKSLRIPRVTSSKLIRTSITSMVAPSHMSQGGRRNSQPQKVLAVSPATPEYLKWSEVPITFDYNDHPDFVPNLGRSPLIVNPIVKDVKLNRVLIDGGSSLNILFLKTIDQMGLSRSMVHPSQALFHGIVLGAATTPIGQIFLPVTFRTWENFRTENIQFEVTDFETTYNAFLGWPALSKFMAIPPLCLLGLEDARAAWRHLHQGRHQAGFPL
jgi:hypothetical protein